MTTAFTELLENSEYFDGSDVNLSKVQHASVNEILEFSAQSIELSSVDKVPIDHSQLSHTASLSLSGSIHPCAALKCRRDRVHELAQFSAFYSDRIYINNFLCDHLAHFDKDAPPDEEVLRSRFTNDLYVLSYLKPFIDAGRIIPITPPHYCKHCLASVSFGNKDDRRIEKAYKRLVQEYRNEARVFIQKVDNAYLIHAKAPEHLLEHGFYGQMSNDLPPEIKQMPRIMRAIHSGEKVEISKTLQERTKYNQHLAGKMFTGIIYELATTNALNTSYLSDSSLEINFIKSLTNNIDIERRNHIIEKYLTCMVPFIGNIDPLVVLQIRDKEEESFLLFRQCLNEAVSEVQSQKDNIRAKDAKQIYHDILEPQLARLDMNVKVCETSTGKRCEADNTWVDCCYFIWSLYWVITRGSCCGSSCTWINKNHWRISW